MLDTQTIIGLMKDTLGLLSSVAFAVPFFRESRYRIFANTVSDARVENAPGRTLRDLVHQHFTEKAEWKVIDLVWGCIGLVFLGLSFLISIIGTLVGGSAACPK
jgi:hypothetical protein